MSKENSEKSMSHHKNISENDFSVKMATAVLKSLPQLVSVLDSNLTYLYANESYYSWFGLTTEQVIGKTVTEVLGQEVADGVMPKIKEALAGKTLNFEAEVPYLRGGTKNVQVDYFPAIASSGIQIGFVAVVNDVTELKKAQKKLQQTTQLLAESEAEYRGFFENLPIGVVAMDTDLLVLSVNPTFQKMLGYSESELKGRKILDFTFAGDLKASQNFRNQQIQNTDYGKLEKRYVTKSGKVVWGRVNTIRVPQSANHNGESFITTIEDITEQKELAEKIDYQKLKIGEASRLASLGEMSAGIAHEINNPLAIILGKVSLAAREVTKERPDLGQIKEHLDKIKITADRVAKIVSGLRSFSMDGEHAVFAKKDLKVKISNLKLLQWGI